SLHCRRPARPCPVARKKQVSYAAIPLARPPVIYARLRRERRVHFLDHGSFQEPGIARMRQHVSEFTHAKVDDLLSRLWDEPIGCADDKLQILDAWGFRERSLHWTRTHAIGFIFPAEQ